MGKTSWVELKRGFKTLLSRNAIVVVLFNIAYQYSTTMKNGFRPLVVKEVCALPVSYVTTMITVFSLTAFIFNVPIGSIVDRKRGALKKVMIAVNLARAVIYLFGYGMVSSKMLCYLVYFLDGIVFCFCSIMAPAMMAISVDRKAMGSAYAVFNGLTAIVVASSKSLGVSLFRDHGQFAAALATTGVAILAVVILSFLDGEKLSDTLRKEQASLAAEERNQRKSGKGIGMLVAGFSLKALPIALCIGLGSIEDNVASAYTALLAFERNFDYLSAQTLIASFSGIITMVIGVICDIINPMILVFLALAGKIVGSMLIATASTNRLFIAGLCCIMLTDFFPTVLRISAAKTFYYRDQGSLNSTIQLLMNICMMIGVFPAGFLAGKYGYGAAFVYDAASSMAGVFAYIWAMIQNAGQKYLPSQGGTEIT